MIFELTDSIAQSVIFAMENQEESFLLDAKTGSLIPAETESADEETIYSLPSWTSRDGYELLESFVSELHVQNAKADLRNVLIAGRGVFRNFKNVIKGYPEVERKWHFYKEKQMRLRVMDWYNALRESWGLASLPDEIEEYDDLIEEDFDFRSYDTLQDRDCVSQGVDAVSKEYEKSAEGELGQAYAALWNLQCKHVEKANEDGFVCRTSSDDFAGCLLVSPLPSCAKETVQLTTLFVKENYRGLGIARTLISFCMTRLRERGIRWFIITRIPQILEPTLVRSGFTKTDFGFVADLKNS